MSRSKQVDDGIGEPIRYDPRFNGPLKRRSCTDIICLLLFIVFIGCWIGLGAYAFVNGDPNKLLIPRDSNGSRCGFDAHVLDKPYLFFFDLTQCIRPAVAFTGCPTPQVCVASCPTSAYIWDAFTDASQLNQLICWYGENPTTLDEARDLVNVGRCARWALPSTPVMNRCVPGDFNFNIFEEWKDYNVTLTDGIIQSANNSIGLLSHAEQIGYDVVSDILNSWKEILLGVAISIIVCIIYIFILRWIAAVLVWASILAALAALSFCVYWSAQNYKYYLNNPYAHEQATNRFEAAFKQSGTWLGILIAFSVILGILLLVVIFLRKRIVLAIALIKEGSKAVGACTSALFFPIVPWILQLCVIAYTIAVAIYVSTVGSPLYEVRDYNSSYCSSCNVEGSVQNGMECDVNTFSCSSVPATQQCYAQCRFIQTSNVAHVIYLHIFNGVGLFWGVFFMSALAEMILAGTFATWYWTFNKSDLPFFAVTVSALRTVRYHLGTLAFGSLIITICRIIRIILEYIDHKLKKYENPVTRAILCCLKCFFWCLEKFLRFINRNAYIMCAIHGKNFCLSAKDAFNLLMRNILRVFVLDKITDFIFFLSKIVVVVGVSAIIYSILEFVSTVQLTYIFVPVIFVAICAYFISTVFFQVYTMAIDTLFLCFLEDCERNDGSPERPYFMSKSLMGVLNKKNK